MYASKFYNLLCLIFNNCFKCFLVSIVYIVCLLILKCLLLMQCQWCKCPWIYWSCCPGCRSIWVTRACQDSFAPASHSWTRMPRWCLSTLVNRAVGISCWSLMKPYTTLPGLWCCLNALLYDFDFTIFNGHNCFHGFYMILKFHKISPKPLLSLVLLKTWCIFTCQDAKVSSRWASLCGWRRQSSCGQCSEPGPRLTEKRRPGTGHGQLLDVPCRYFDVIFSTFWGFIDFIDFVMFVVPLEPGM